MIASQAVEGTWISRYAWALTSGCGRNWLGAPPFLSKLVHNVFLFLTPYNLKLETYKVVPQIS